MKSHGIVFLIRSGKRQGCPLSSLLFNIVLEVLEVLEVYSIGRKRNKRHPNWKEETKLSWFADDMIVYIEIPIVSTKKLLE